MKKYFMMLPLLFIFTIIFSGGLLLAQSPLPSEQIKDLNNRKFDTKTFNNDGKPFIICFWATWCKPCLEEMKTYNELYEEWQEETGVKIFAVSIDNSRNSKKVAPFVRGKGWLFDVFLDENQDFMRAMNVTNPPHTFIINGEGQIVWSHIGYAIGDEDELIEKYKEIVQAEKEKEEETEK